MANRYSAALDPKQVEYVCGKYGEISAADLGTELGCSRNVIAGTWRRYRKANNLEPLTPYHELTERNTEIFSRYRDRLQGASQIAREMGLGCNVVEKVLRRMRRAAGMKALGKPLASPRPKKKRCHYIKLADRPKPLAPHAPAYGPPVTFDQLDKLPLGADEICMCRHYVGSPHDSLFCGRRSQPGRPYCEEHTMIAYRANTARPRDDKRAAQIKKQAKEFLEWRKRQTNEMREAA